MGSDLAQELGLICHAAPGPEANLRRSRSVDSRAASLAVACALDVGLGEPPAFCHPVVLIGRALAFGSDRHSARSATGQLAGGAAALLATASLAAVAGLAVDRMGGGRLLGLLARGAALKPLFALRMLLEEASAVRTALDAQDLREARKRLRSLVSRPTAELTPGLVAAAAIESLAENLGDSVLAPWFYYAGFGLPGATVYRVVNTADAMYGYRGEKEWLGKAAALTDDALNWVPSRFAAAAIVAAARLRLSKAAARAALASWRADGGATASPNAGRPMAAMAGALGRRLEKPGHYVLGAAFSEPAAADIRRAADLTLTAAAVSLVAISGALLFAGR